MKERKDLTIRSNYTLRQGRKLSNTLRYSSFRCFTPYVELLFRVTVNLES